MVRSGGRKGENWRTSVVRCGGGVGLRAPPYRLLKVSGDQVAQESVQ